MFLAFPEHHFVKKTARTSASENTSILINVQVCKVLLNHISFFFPSASITSICTEFTVTFLVLFERLLQILYLPRDVVFVCLSELFAKYLH